MKGEDRSVSSGCLARALDCARAQLARNPSDDPSLAGIAHAVGVSQRTLQRQFSRELDSTPSAIVLRWRLDAARRTLAAGEARSVLAAALQHGFDHPGRFAIAYRQAFGEPPSATLRTARSGMGKPSPRETPIIDVRPLEPIDPCEAAQARLATDELAIALVRTPELGIADAGSHTPPDPTRLRLEGRLDQGCVVLSLTCPAKAALIWMERFELRRRTGLHWAERAAAALRSALALHRLEHARRTPRRLADAETLYLRARPAALTLEPAGIGAALDLLHDALHRDPAHARAHALTGWCRAQGANHHMLGDSAAERLSALDHGRRALTLAPDDPQVLTFVAGVLALNKQLDEAERLVGCSLALDPYQPEAWRRRGFIQNFRGNHELATKAFRQALAAWPTGNDAVIALVGLGIARFIAGDYGRSARLLTRAVEQRPSLGWPYRFLTAAAVHSGTDAAAQRSLLSLQRAFPDLTIERCWRSDALHADALRRVIEGLAEAGLPG